MNELSERLRTAVDFLKKNGYARSDSSVAGRLGVPKSSLCMSMSGTRVPTWELLLDLCDAYPINFAWVRTGAGNMIKEDREAALLKRIAELEAELRRLKE